jgi:autotransporter-associated beta strand protein
MLTTSEVALAQRVLGLDISAWQGNISQTTWNNIKNVENRQFVILRSSRGGTTGYYDQNNSDNNPPTNTFSQRYDDPYYVQNINRATTAGMFAGSYHFSRPDIIASTLNSGGIANTGADEADHFIQMAGAFMRPGYLLPVHDFEAGDGIRTDNQLAQFCLDFSNRIYEVMGIRPAIYTNGNYAANILGTATNPSPSQTVAAYPTLWSARWPNQADPNSIDVQNGEPKDTYTPIYGPWDDFGVTHPWVFWQYASTGRLQSFNNGGSNLDMDVVHGDIEYLKDYLVPALWMNNNNGDWSTLANWNSGQSPIVPVPGPGQVAPVGTQTLPTSRLPGAAGSGVTSGQHDTVILDRPSANITLTLSTGTHNIRKMYMRETLNITGGSLTINYDPNYVSDTVNYPNALRSGPISAQFSGSVTLSGTGSLSVNTLQVDATRTFTLAGGTGALTFKTISLMPDAATPAKIAITGDVNINPLNNATATIANGGGAGSTGFVDLSGGTRVFNVGNGTSDVDLDVVVPIINGGLTKNGAGTMRLRGNNTFTGAVTVNGGVLRYNHSSGLTSATVVTVNNGGVLDMNNVSDTIASLSSAAGNTTGIVTPGTAGLTLAATSGTSTYLGTINGTGALAKNGAATQILSGNNTLNTVAVNAGTLLFNGINTTGAVTVNGGVLGGTGSISGAVTVNSGTHLAPGASIESLGVGALTLNAGSVLDFELGASGAADLINVTGLLTLGGGSLNLIDLGGMGAGLYTLIDYGTISGRVANLGVPTGPSNFKYGLIDTGSTIDLRVSILGDFDFDGAVDGADYAVWRNGLGTTYTPADYDVWRAHFGDVAGSGSSLEAGAAVPEPAAVGLLLCGMLILIGGRRHRPSV